MYMYDTQCAFCSVHNNLINKNAHTTPTHQRENYEFHVTFHFCHIMVLLQGTQGNQMASNNATEPDGQAIAAPPGASQQGNIKH